ncbi:hypothetical protein RFI_17951, partial [Reticulomyxa filosa]
MEEKDKTNQTPVRSAGVTRTILIRPLSPETTVEQIEEFVDRAALNKPLRVDLIRPRKYAQTPCCYAYVTFPTNQDCVLVISNLNLQTLNGTEVIYLLKKKKKISFSTIPRPDLQGKTCVLEITTDPPFLRDQSELAELLNTFSPTDKNSQRVWPHDVWMGKGNGMKKRKWMLFYDTPLMATLAFQSCSGRWFKDRFVILGYQSHPNEYLYDRQECFAKLTNRMMLEGIPRSTSIEDIKTFVEQHGFKRDDIVDVEFFFQTKYSLLSRLDEKWQNNQNFEQGDQKNKSPRRAAYGFAVITWKTFDLADEAFEKLNDLEFGGIEYVVKTKYKSPQIEDILKEDLKDKTTVLHMANIPWFVTCTIIKQWFASNGVFASVSKPRVRKTTEENKDEQKNNDKQAMDVDFVDSFLSDMHSALNKEEEDKEEQIPIEKKNLYPTPIRTHIKYRDGFPIGRAHVAFNTPQKATEALLAMNGKYLGGRKIL